jgi:hypothetical protein
VITVTVDPRKLITTLDTLSERQLPFACMKALNECAVKFQEDERKVIQAGFIIRRPWVLQGVKINREDFATKQKLSVRVHIDPTRDFLGKFERGGTRTPRAGKKGLAVPIAAKASAKSIVKASLRPKALHFVKRSGGGSGVTVFTGDRKTILIQRPDGSGVILQRQGRKVAKKKLLRGAKRLDRLVLLYVLRPRTPVPASLHFEQTAKKSFLANWPGVFTSWWNKAIATARPT